MTVALDQKPPIELGVEIETAEGAIFRLDADQLKAQNIPTAISFTTQRGDGFATASFTLSREIFKDWPDLNLLDEVRFVARDGSIAYEGLIQSFPRTNDPQQQITVQCVGWMTSLKWRPMGALIIDRRLASWAEMSQLWQAAVLTAGYTPISGNTTKQSEPCVVMQTTGKIYKPYFQMEFDSNGQAVNNIEYGGLERIGFAPQSSDSNVFFSNFFAQSTIGTGRVDGTDLTGIVGGWSVTGANSGVVGLFGRYEFAGAAGAEGQPYGFVVKNPAVIGAHGLTVRGANPETGFYVSDIMEHLVEAYGSRVVWEGEENQFILTQCTWHDSPTSVYEAIQGLNNFVLWETNIWEERKFYFEPADLTKTDWQIRTSDPGVSVQFQGDSIESFASGVVITYSDFFGHTYTLYPNEHPELQDENENNAAARHGEDIWLSYTIPWQCLEGEALQFGRAYLAQNNRPKRPGSFTVVGHIQDSAGHWRRASDVRCSQTLSIVDDLYEGEPRLITATSYDDESGAMTITVDAPPMTIEAWIARQQNALESRNLTSA